MLRAGAGAGGRDGRIEALRGAWAFTLSDLTPDQLMALVAVASFWSALNRPPHHLELRECLGKAANLSVLAYKGALEKIRVPKTGAYQRKRVYSPTQEAWTALERFGIDQPGSWT